MKSNEKKMIVILLVIAVVIIGIVWFTTRSKDKEVVGENNNNVSQEVQKEEMTTTLEDGTKLNTSNGLKSEKEFEGLTNKDNKTELAADIENNSTRDKEAMLVDVVLLDKSGQEVGRIGGRISPIRAGETKQFSTSSMKDYSGAYDFKLELKD